MAKSFTSLRSFVPERKENLTQFFTDNKIRVATVTSDSTKENNICGVLHVRIIISSLE